MSAALPSIAGDLRTVTRPYAVTNNRRSSRPEKPRSSSPADDASHGNAEAPAD
jgi:hypothetical protein